jgi:hypothetical protein
VESFLVEYVIDRTYMAVRMANRAIRYIMMSTIAEIYVIMMRYGFCE